LETSTAAGAAFERAEISRAAAFGDLDNDGDIDVVVTTNGGPIRLLLNQSEHSITGCKCRLPKMRGTGWPSGPV